MDSLVRQIRSFGKRKTGVEGQVLFVRIAGFSFHEVEKIEHSPQIFKSMICINKVSMSPPQGIEQQTGFCFPREKAYLTIGCCFPVQTGPKKLKGSMLTHILNRYFGGKSKHSCWVCFCLYRTGWEGLHPGKIRQILSVLIADASTSILVNIFDLGNRGTSERTGSNCTLQCTVYTQSIMYSVHYALQEYFKEKIVNSIAYLSRNLLYWGRAPPT